MASLQTCPLCDSPNYTIAWEHAGRQFGACDACGLAFVRPFEAGAATEVGAAPSSITKASYVAMMKENPQQREAAAHDRAARRLQVYKSVLGRTPANICEIGAGDGAYSAAYAALGVSYKGFDINPDLVEQAQALGRSVFCGGPETVLGLGLRFDVVFCSQVLEHILAPKPFLCVVRQILSEDGVLHLDVPNHDGLSSRLRRLYPRKGEWGFLQPPHHQIAYTAKTLAALLNITGFRPLWIRSKGNFDKVWGQLTVGPSVVGRLGLRVAGMIGMGSLLVTLARKAHQ